MFCQLIDDFTWAILNENASVLTTINHKSAAANDFIIFRK